jgi:Uncharacterized enzyme involved in biosynthesis of extracellular polysaccharides
MFSVIFELNPKIDQWDAYLGYAKLLRPELVQIDGFIGNARYGSKRRGGRVLSLSTWRDEKALVRWRTHASHHEVQEKGRFEVFQDYHLRVGQVTADNRVPDGHVWREQRLDETETGASKTISLIEAQRPPDLPEKAPAKEIASRLGLPVAASGLVDWDVFEAILTPGDLLLPPIVARLDRGGSGRAERRHPRRCARAPNSGRARLRHVRARRSTSVLS